MRRLLLALGGLLVVGGGAAILLNRRGVTFTEDLDPILQARCAGCHQEGGAAPFPLVTYEDVRKRRDLIVDVTRRRLMPPWMPEPGGVAFVGDRSLSDEQIALFQRWAGDGAPGGPAVTHSPAPPRKPDDWVLGKPDLILRVEAPFALAAEGRDVYRNFVIPLPPFASSPRYVRALEFHPGNPKAVHHAFLFVDRTLGSLALDRKSPEPGFPGLHVPPSAQAPPGHFLSWQPGKLPLPDPEDMAWPLASGSSIVIQTHLRPSGKVEQVQPLVGLFFTDKPPTRIPEKIGLWSHDIRIPAGERAVTVRDSITLPADVDVLRILPHAHFLARIVEAQARLPDGSTQTLLRIPAWDFNWQGDYVYKEPRFLPKGTVLSMSVTYDNSADNARNPNQPPRDVAYGVESGDEMAEVWLQVLPRAPDGAALIEQAMQPKVLESGVAYNRYLLARDPSNVRAHTELGKALYFRGESPQAEREFLAALRLEPDAETHYFLGLVHRTGKRLDQAESDFRRALALDPVYAKAHGNLGLVLLEKGDLPGAERSLQTALTLNPDDALARETLEEIREARKKPR
jgi:hypothetical protein